MELLHGEVRGRVLDAATRVHSALGPGLLESVYEECLCYELRLQGVPYRRQPPVPIVYNGVRFECGFRTDLIVRDCVMVELKSVQKVHPIEEARLITHLKLSGLRVGLLINFNVLLLKEGVLRRVV